MVVFSLALLSQKKIYDIMVVAGFKVWQTKSADEIVAPMTGLVSK